MGELPTAPGGDRGDRFADVTLGARLPDADADCTEEERPAPRETGRWPIWNSHSSEESSSLWLSSSAITRFTHPRNVSLYRMLPFTIGIGRSLITSIRSVRVGPCACGASDSLLTPNGGNRLPISAGRRSLAIFSRACGSNSVQTSTNWCSLSIGTTPMSSLARSSKFSRITAVNSCISTYVPNSCHTRWKITPVYGPPHPSPRYAPYRLSHALYGSDWKQ
mmetsp:Transcript_47806/g.112838  ORF Transcript_47806/g.112838 Transcript_47806/m.112838 type:complete len:221 (+) Transcript_47806:192-854(+)